MALVFNNGLDCDFMDSDEQIKTHLLSVWLEEKRLFARGKECMLFVTNRGLYIVSKTEAKPQWWKSAVQRQILMLLKEPNNTIIIHDGYDEKKLDLDLENLKNLRFRFAEIVDVESEEKSWGSVLVLKLRNEDKVVKYHLSIVRDWVSYPIKSPMTFLKINWLPVVQYIKSEMKR